MNVGATIKRLRKDRNWTQEYFASEIGISVTSLSLIESGSTRPNKSTMNKICEVFGIAESFLYVMSISEEDVPDNKKEVYRILAPNLKIIVEQLTEGN
ncbi:MAG: hypothetical protein A2W85_13340 [Bacteroidetes bacterium GWF2_41_31]|nr:MAG: hypothetical protein A2W85_13340 [Bacteroidetes bacterium GWF2_41_31]OFZ03028.1 MAG: hypothetical protein A2338_04215 [Bacteroidetes bacterium RIFOXYB12_FULL_41_6]